MPIEYAEIILAVVALAAGVMYLFVRRSRVKKGGGGGKKSKNAVRPTAPARGAAAATTAEAATPGQAVATGVTSRAFMRPVCGTPAPAGRYGRGSRRLDHHSETIRNRFGCVPARCGT